MSRPRLIYAPPLNPQMITNPRAKKVTLQDRFMRNVLICKDGHWLWTGARFWKYGQISVGQVNRRAHEVSYRMFRGAIRQGEFLKACSVEYCVHPDHVSLAPFEKGKRQ